MQKLNKQQLRDTLLIRRRCISPSERHTAALAALPLLLAHPLFTMSQQIACYLPEESEFDCTPFIDAIVAAKKKCYLPILTNDKSLQFALYHPNDPLCLNRYRILEPQNKIIVPCEQLDCVLLPLVGFDLQGKRLGMGGGYYDRTFAFLNEKKTKKPCLIGLAYECQQIESIPYEKHDVLLHGLLTEKKIILFNDL